MNVTGIEDVEEGKMHLWADLAKRDIFVWNELGECLSPVVARNEALVKD